MSSRPPAPANGDGVDSAFFHHPVSKLDTLAGLAIKYGVEVADIKKANGLATDLQMFGHQTLRIPKPGHSFPRSHEHKRSSQAGSSMGMRNASRSSVGSESSKTRWKDRRTLYTATMNLFRGHSSSTQQIPHDEGTEMTCYHSNGHDYSEEEPTCLRKTMKTERSLHACGSNTGIRKTKEISRVHNVDMPMTIPAFGEIANFNKRDALERNHTNFDALSGVSSSEVEIRQDDTLQSMLPSTADSLEARIDGSSVFSKRSLADASFTEACSSKMIKSPITSNSLAHMTIDVNLLKSAPNNSSPPVS